ncbi:benzoate/toluate 1,2-dioxygenase beta subunit [Modicisalibacter ilicicola DSM 19980]|uniref:Benzoate/toluate 1,2-dioxygenase beta subunit n=1 Tax=Modicisalibacter ilicicola DSM 19980 TaxID=1121942 RepID=A0A1M4W7D2_9GAMM|nr:benzoate 1,2-dioxygenase small subunit [Halomonas ilicicola]SHE77184.1 benzoate/toluate 1,2-dioxygenase beta subunit [Halomonas ilicicola DSM 19980]
MSMNFLDIQAFIHREARLLDDREWDEWLTCYSKNAVFWMPTWDDDDTLVTDPQNDVSLIYYPNREGLEDRVYRIKTERSGATSLPEPRTTHQVSNLEVLSQQDDKVELRFNWHTLSYRYQETIAYYGTSFYTLDVSGETPLIEKKTVQLNNDSIHQVIDIYHV